MIVFLLMIMNIQWQGEGKGYCSRWALSASGVRLVNFSLQSILDCAWKDQDNSFSDYSSILNWNISEQRNNAAERTDQALIRRAFPTRPQPAFSTQLEFIHHLSHQLNLTMALLVDKLRPRSLDALTYHPELSDRLRSLVNAPPVHLKSNIN